MERDGLPDAVFHPDADRFVPTELARGPWDVNAQHGGAPTALLARAIERFEPGPATHIARLTVELLRPVPLVPLEISVRMVRPGRKFQVVEASLSADGDEVVRASAVRLRETPLELPDSAFPSAAAPPQHDMPPPEDLDERPINFGDAMEWRATRLGWQDWGGPASCWFRLVRPIVAGEEPSPLMRVAAAADYGNGISSSLDYQVWLFINPDLTIYLHRLPEGEWVCLDSITWPGTGGVGVAESALFDERGRIGRAVQSLLIDRR